MRPIEEIPKILFDVLYVHAAFALAAQHGPIDGNSSIALRATPQNFDTGSEELIHPPMFGSNEGPIEHRLDCLGQLDDIVNKLIQQPCRILGIVHHPGRCAESLLCPAWPPFPITKKQRYGRPYPPTSNGTAWPNAQNLATATKTTPGPQEHPACSCIGTAPPGRDDPVPPHTPWPAYGPWMQTACGSLGKVAPYSAGRSDQLRESDQGNQIISPGRQTATTLVKTEKPGGIHTSVSPRPNDAVSNVIIL